MTTVSIPKPMYKKLLKKAQLGEMVLTFIEKYPIEEYSDQRARDFQKNDFVSKRLRKRVLSFIKKGD